MDPGAPPARPRSPRPTTNGVHHDLQQFLAQADYNTDLRVITNHTDFFAVAERQSRKETVQ